MTVKFSSDTTLASKLVGFDDIFTFNTDRSLLFAQDLWGPYLTALAEGKPPPEPPPDSKGHVNAQMSPSKGAASFVRQTLAITIQLFGMTTRPTTISTSFLVDMMLQTIRN